MSASLVPVIFNRLTKRVLRAATLDYEYQLSDPAFWPKHPSESICMVPMKTYETFGKSSSGFPLLEDVQNYVNGNVL